MKKINWEQDYQGEFVCPKCEKGKLGLGGFGKNGKRLFLCIECNICTTSSLDLKFRSRHLDSRLKDEHIDWGKEYHDEFICPKCETQGMSVQGINKETLKRRFQCSHCKNTEQSSCAINIQSVKDPLNLGLKWYLEHRIKDFICPKCQDKNMYFTGIFKSNQKKTFRCKTCKHSQYDSISLNPKNIGKFVDNLQILVRPFDWEDNAWDLRAINPNFDELDRHSCIVNFEDFHLKWLKIEVKKYVEYLCKIENCFSTIKMALSSLRYLSAYLLCKNISGFDQINRNLILDYLVKEKKVTKQNLGILRKFFATGSSKGWFNIDSDIIRNADYPKSHQYNPDPISNMVREKIEQNLHLLPDPIARMWLIGYFSAMRPSELALIKQDCLVQEGEHWKLIWHRKKTNDYHEIPISRTIAKVVQEQQEYMQNLWGDSWDYLFCRYHNLSMIDPSQPNFKPVKKIITNQISHPLLVGIRSLITSLDIRDENGQLAKFQSRFLRPTRATDLFAQGHDLSIVSAWLGHKHFRTTSTHYTQVSCDLMEKEAGHIHKALVNSNGHRISYESYPKSFWDNPIAHKLELSGTHINTPIYGMCGLPLDQDCHKFRACYTCQSFVATVEKLPQYIKVYDELRSKQANAMSAGQEVLVEQFGRQADQLDKIIASLQAEAA